jgi:hypothetical protein
MARTALIKAFKRQNEYAAQAENCGNCQHFKKGYTVLINSLPKMVRPYCKLGEFFINKNAICNLWKEKK